MVSARSPSGLLSDVVPNSTEATPTPGLGPRHSCVDGRQRSLWWSVTLGLSHHDCLFTLTGLLSQQMVGQGPRLKRLPELLPQSLGHSNGPQVLSAGACAYTKSLFYLVRNGGKGGRQLSEPRPAFSHPRVQTRLQGAQRWKTPLFPPEHQALPTFHQAIPSKAEEVYGREALRDRSWDSENSPRSHSPQRVAIR